MKVILLQDVAKVGKKLEIKEVSDGYALNFLIPKKLAKLATDNAMKENKAQKTKSEEQAKERQERIIENIKKLKDVVVSMEVKVDKKGNLFAGIGKKEIINAVKEQKAIYLEPENIILEKPIKDVSQHEINIQSGEETAKFMLNFVEA